MLTTTASSQSPQLPLAFINQQLNLLIEIISFRLKNLAFMHRTSFLHLLNNLFTPCSSVGLGQVGQQSGAQGQSSSSQQQQVVQNQRGGASGSGADFMKHHIIYVNTHCAILKILSSFSGSDYYELLNSIVSSPPNKPGNKHFLNTESEELNKAIIVLISHAVHLTCNRKNSFKQ